MMLFSTTPLSQFFTIGSSGSKSSIDKHHIFPKNYLTSIGFEDDRDRNQIANFTYIDYPTNIEISDMRIFKGCKKVANTVNNVFADFLFYQKYA
ncbi:MAG: hypothetical protein PUC98_00650, partial [Clostridiales bacterium]|nr:hypothetical protein [Clostridiales bacterium]